MEAIRKTIMDRYLDKEFTLKSQRMRTILDNKFRLEVPHDDNFIDHEILNSYRYSVLHNKMRFTKVIFRALNYWYKCPDDIVNIMAADMSITAKCLILVDDVQDNSLLRRGRPCAHLIYGAPNTLNTAGFILASHFLYDLIQTDNAQEAIACNDLLIDAFRGQAMEIYWRDNLICPTEEEYKLMAMRKTGNFFLMCLNWLKECSPASSVDATPLGEPMTLYLQIFDDYQSLTLADYQETKGFCEDITEGKFSFPIIHVVRNYPEEGKIILEILKERTLDIDRLEYCRSIIEKYGGLEYTRQVLIKYKELVITESEKLGPNPLFKETFIDKYFDGRALVA